MSKLVLYHHIIFQWFINYPNKYWNIGQTLKKSSLLSSQSLKCFFTMIMCVLCMPICECLTIFATYWYVNTTVNVFLQCMHLKIVVFLVILIMASVRGGNKCLQGHWHSEQKSSKPKFHLFSPMLGVTNILTFPGHKSS